MYFISLPKTKIPLSFSENLETNYLRTYDYYVRWTKIIMYIGLWSLEARLWMFKL